RPTWLGIGIDKDQPITRSGIRAGIARAPNLIDRLEDDVSPGGASQFGGAIRGVVVADDELGLPACFRKGGHRVMKLAQGARDESFLIVSWNYHRNFHSAPPVTCSRCSLIAVLASRM